ncbi:HD domain-containing protein [Candidatus Woesearchaeota archaeon]|nr:HD domain-containing protein [Candidatus Woesearchaeota archaeon]
MGELYAKALILAISAHNGQFRKISKDPFIIHPVRVSELVLDWYVKFEDVELLRVCAVLHDVLEDTWVDDSVLRNLFGERVLSIVEELSIENSIRKSKRICKDEYIESLKSASIYAKLIKLADIWDNVQDTKFVSGWKSYFEDSKCILEIIDVEGSVFEAVFNEKKMALLKVVDDYLTKFA